MVNMKYKTYSMTLTSDIFKTLVALIFFGMLWYMLPMVNDTSSNIHIFIQLGYIVMWGCIPLAIVSVGLIIIGLRNGEYIEHNG